MDRYEKLIQSFKDHMESTPSEECCGIITKDFEYIPCDNLSPYPKDSFILDPKALLKYADSCWGIFHSHTSEHSEIPSNKDADSTIFKQYKFIMGSPSNVFYEYWLDEEIKSLRIKAFSEESLIC